MSIARRRRQIGRCGPKWSGRGGGGVAGNGVVQGAHLEPVLNAVCQAGHGVSGGVCIAAADGGPIRVPRLAVISRDAILICGDCAVAWIVPRQSGLAIVTRCGFEVYRRRRRRQRYNIDLRRSRAVTGRVHRSHLELVVGAVGQIWHGVFDAGRGGNYRDLRPGAPSFSAFFLLVLPALDAVVVRVRPVQGHLRVARGSGEVVRRRRNHGDQYVGFVAVFRPHFEGVIGAVGQ